MNELLQKLNTALRVCVEIEQRYAEINELQQRRDRKEDGSKGIVAFLVFFIITIACFFAADPLIERASDTAKIAICVTLFILWIVAFIIIFIKTKALIRKTTDRLNGEIAERHAAVQRLYNDNRENMAFLPGDYQYPIAIDYLIRMIQTGRAATLPEALDKYDEQLHRWKLEEASAQMLALQQQQAAHLANIQRNTGISAVADVMSAAINISNSW